MVIFLPVGSERPEGRPVLRTPIHLPRTLGDQIKVLWADSDGLCLFTKRLERGRFVWPVTCDGKVHLTPTRLSMLLEGINRV